MLISPSLSPEDKFEDVIGAACQAWERAVLHDLVNPADAVLELEAGAHWLTTTLAARTGWVTAIEASPGRWRPYTIASASRPAGQHVAVHDARRQLPTLDHRASGLQPLQEDVCGHATHPASGVRHKSQKPPQHPDAARAVNCRYLPD